MQGGEPLISSHCPDCLSPGTRVGWRPAGRFVEHIFVCTNLVCSRARDPWKFLEPLRGKGPQDLLSRILSIPRKFLRWAWSHSKFTDPCWTKVNGRWIRSADYDEIEGDLEELQEASR